MIESRRQHCPHCLRPSTTCICMYVRTVKAPVQVVILQHPLERQEAKNTGRLLHLCLINSQIFVGEDFSCEFFESLQQDHYLDLLLYPETLDDLSLGVLPAPILPLHDIKTKKRPIRLWVLDATWRKSRKMLYLNKALQKMPRFSLTETPTSIYSIRKAHNENQLSTLEATCYALQTLEQYTVEPEHSEKPNYAQLLVTMEDFIQHQLTFIPNRP
jgi:DTW domain-containing protein YfiP